MLSRQRLSTLTNVNMYDKYLHVLIAVPTIRSDDSIKTFNAIIKLIEEKPFRPFYVWDLEFDSAICYQDYDLTSSLEIKSFLCCIQTPSTYCCYV